MMRHPSRQDLGAHFDGEDRPGVATHLAGCARCQAWTGELRRVRAAVRGEPVPAPAPAHLHRPAWAYPATAVALVVAVLGVAGAAGLLSRDATTTLASRGMPPAVPSDSLPASDAAPEAAPGTKAHPPASGAHPATSSPSPAPDSSPAATDPASRPTTTAGPPAPATAEAPDPGSPAAVPAPDGTATPAPVRLAVVVPSQGVWAGEGDDVVAAARRAVAAANRAERAEKHPEGDGRSHTPDRFQDSDPAGRRERSAQADKPRRPRDARPRAVELIVVSAEDRAAVDALPKQVDALVGGFGIGQAPGGLPWVFPADPAVDGPGVVRAEHSPAEVGARLGAELAAEHPDARVGVIVGGPAEAPMAEGLARSVTVDQVESAPGTACDREVAQLRKQGVDVLAVAGPPALARRCAAAARTLGRPDQTLLMLPSAAYEHLEADPAAQGARTFLGLPWPTSDESGSRRFRSAAGGDRAYSYRALVTFAAVEAAVEAAQATGSPAPATGRYRSDLYDIDAGANRAGTVVRAGFGRWAAP